MDGRWSPSVITGWIDQVAAMNKWVTLFFADPLTVSDPHSVEVIGQSFSRLKPAWVRSSSYALTLNEEIVFRALPPGTNVVAVGVMNAAFGGALLARELVSPVQTYPTGGTFRLDIGEWVLGIQVPAA